jgi:membrane-bound lytic murein transglycosylase B
MQFIPSTWEAYGMGGDIDDPRDAIMGAANYLHASGAPGDSAQALYAYNPSDAYVRAVLRYAHAISRDRHRYFGFHSWQVFVNTPDGIVRITGPGLAD